MTARTSTMDAAAVKARAAQARAFLEAARLQQGESLAANSVAATDAVHAGIAASDAMCGASLGFCSRGENHDQAVELLARAIRDAAPSRDLRRLLSLKSLAGYSPEMLTEARTAEAIKYAERLVSAMETVIQ